LNPPNDLKTIHPNMPAIKKNRKPTTRVRDPATGRFRGIAVQPVVVLPPCCLVPQLPDLAAVPVEPVIKIEPQEEEVDWKAEYWRWRDKYVSSDGAFCRISGMLTGFADSAEATNESIGGGF
jgi:hypothetical protein